MESNRVLRRAGRPSVKEVANGHTDSHRGLRGIACCYRNHWAVPGEKGVTNSVAGKKEAGQPFKKPGLNNRKRCPAVRGALMYAL